MKKYGNIDELVDKHIDNMDLNINSIIIETIAGKKNITLPHDKIIDKLLTLDSIKVIEAQITTNILTQLGLEKFGDKDLIHVRTKRVGPKKAHNNSSGLDNSIMDSDNLLSLLIEEILLTKDKIKFENYIGDLSNFDTSHLITNSRYFDVLKAISQHLSQSNNFLIPNMINFFNKIVKCQDVYVLTESLMVLLEYLNINLDHFYKTAFDITKFYKISFNIELVNGFIIALNNLHIRRLDGAKVNKLMELLFKFLLKNYDNDFLYANKSLLNENISTSQNGYGISTNYILLLIFTFDSDLCIFKILFKNNAFRNYILTNYDKIDSLTFLNKNELIKSFNTKNCFLWKHFSVLEQIFPAKKISKKYLLFAWTAIRIHFLGYVMRYASLKLTYLRLNDLSCSQTFENVFLLVRDIKAELDLDDYLYSELYYLGKEILCDIVLYCGNPECMKLKYKILQKYNSKESHMGKLIDDIKSALKNNVYFNNI
jgi:hypothetical protein